jgi:hypothetical protein
MKQNENSNAKLDFDQICFVMLRLHTRNAVVDYRELVKSTIDLEGGGGRGWSPSG